MQVKALLQQRRQHKGTEARPEATQPGEIRSHLLQAIDAAIAEAFYQRTDVCFISDLRIICYLCCWRRLPTRCKASCIMHAASCRQCPAIVLVHAYSL